MAHGRTDIFRTDDEARESFDLVAICGTLDLLSSPCDVTVGECLGLSDQCANSDLRVGTGAFLVLNDFSTANFAEFGYADNVVNSLHLAKAFPAESRFAKYTEKKCSPLQVTWSLRPNCAKIDINSLNKWREGDVFKENYAHGVRQLVTSPELLSRID